jgi:DNA-binding transcriptional MerR regulator
MLDLPVTERFMLYLEVLHMNIKDATKRTGLSEKTIRYYEETGLLRVKRNERTGYRQFEEADINILRVIKAYRGLGISLQEIKTIFQRESSLPDILISQINGLEDQISLLQDRKAFLQAFLHTGGTSPELITDFEDIIYCNPASVEEKLQKLDVKAIVLASMGASPQANEFLQSIIPQLKLKEEQHRFGRVPIKEINKAQIDIVLQLNSR